MPEYPPDAHRGFDVPAALFTYLDASAPPATWQQQQQRAVSAAVLEGGSGAAPGSGDAQRGSCQAPAGDLALDAGVPASGVLGLLLPTPFRQVRQETQCVIWA